MKRWSQKYFYIQNPIFLEIRSRIKDQEKNHSGINVKTSRQNHEGKIQNTFYWDINSREFQIASRENAGDLRIS